MDEKAMTAARGAVVTGVGGRSGIGAAICRALLRDGWSVVACGWTAYAGAQPWAGSDCDGLEPLVDELGATGRFHWRDVDLEDTGAIPALFDAAHALVGPIDALVAAHARSLNGGIMEVTAEEFDRHMAVNARGTLLLIQEFARRWKGEPGTGRVVTFVSGPPLDGEIAYAASKGAIEWLTWSAGAELAPRGISVNAVDPGPTDTGWMSEELAAHIERRSPMRRIGTPADAAELVAFLCSERGGWITGQVIRSDGGWSTLR
jgi:3-oxoacyl-[acyl-carrier protein] reductase